MSGLSNLIQELAEQFQEVDQMRSLGRDAHLDLTQIDLHGPSRQAWTALLYGAYKQRRLASLFETIRRENVSLAPLLAAVDGAGSDAFEPFVSPIDLTSIALDEACENASSEALAAALNRLPIRLLALAKSAAPPTTDEVDSAIDGRQTADAKAAATRYRSQCASHEASLAKQIRILDLQALEVGREIAKLHAMRPPEPPKSPEPPTMPPRPIENFSVMGDGATNQAEINSWYTRCERLRRDYERLLEDFPKEQLRYAAALDIYRTHQSRTPGLEAQVNEIERESRRVSNAIETFRLQQQSTLVEWDDKIRKARDLDMADAVRALLDLASTNMRGPSPLDGFAIYLLAAALGVAFRRVQPTCAAPLVEVFAEQDDWTEVDASKRLEEVAAAWLAVAMRTFHTIQKNSSRKDRIAAALEKPAGEVIDQRIAGIARLCEAPLPEVPTFLGLLSPAAIQRAAKLCEEGRQTLATLCDSIAGERADVEHGLARQAKDARSTARELLYGMQSDATREMHIAAALASVLDMTSRAALTLSPGFLRLTVSARAEVKRRTGLAAEELIARSVGRRYLATEAEKMINSSRPVRLLRSVEDLRESGQRCSVMAERFTQAAQAIQRLPEANRDELVATLRNHAIASVIPYVGVAVSIRIAYVVERLRKEGVLSSRLNAYADLSRRGWRWIAAVGLISCALGTFLFVLLTHFADVIKRSLPEYSTAMWLAAAAYLAISLVAAAAVFRWFTPPTAE